MTVRRIIDGEWLVITAGDTEYRVPVTGDRYAEQRARAEREYRRALGGLVAETDDAEVTMREALQVDRETGNVVRGTWVTAGSADFIIDTTGERRRVSITFIPGD